MECGHIAWYFHVVLFVSGYSLVLIPFFYYVRKNRSDCSPFRKLQCRCSAFYLFICFVFLFVLITLGYVRMFLSFFFVLGLRMLSSLIYNYVFRLQVMMLYKLYDRGFVSSLDDPVTSYAPDFFVNNPFNANITLRYVKMIIIMMMMIIMMTTALSGTAKILRKVLSL